MITVNEARSMHIADLRRVGDELAMRQVALREAGAALVIGVLRAVATSSYPAEWRGYSGTAGWHVTAYVTPEHTVGFVNIAKGVAVTTDVQLDDETIEALTVPEQAAGVLASGAAAWTAPDAGIGSGPEAPSGWTQLVLDLRGDVVPVRCKAWVCAWGLRTCYSGRRGEPGHDRLDAKPACLGSRSWDLTSEQIARLLSVGEPVLRRIALHLAEIAGVREVVERVLPNIPDAIRATGAYEFRFGAGYCAADAARCAVRDGVATAALCRAGIGRLSALSGDVSDVGGMQYWDLYRDLLEQILVRDLTPTAEALWAAAQPHVARRLDEPEWWLHQRVVEPALKDLGARLADEVLADAVHRDNVDNFDEQALLDALYADGYLTVKIPIAYSVQQ